MIVKGEITEVYADGNCVISTARPTSCSHSCADCASCSLPKTNITVSNPDSYKIGSSVLADIKDNPPWGRLIAVYLVPVLLIIVASIVLENSFGDNISPWLFLGITFGIIALDVLFARLVLKRKPVGKITHLLK